MKNEHKRIRTTIAEENIFKEKNERREEFAMGVFSNEPHFESKASLITGEDHRGNIPDVIVSESCWQALAAAKFLVSAMA